MKVDFYSDGKGKTINSNLFSTHAEDWAKKVCLAGLNFKKDKLEKNKISQIRKFYDEVLQRSSDLKSGEDYRVILPYIKMLNAKVAYAEGRNLVTEDFKLFIKQSLDHLTEQDPKTFDIFTNFFEAFMGYYKFYESQYKK